MKPDSIILRTIFVFMLVLVVGEVYLFSRVSQLSLGLNAQVKNGAEVAPSVAAQKAGAVQDIEVGHNPVAYVGTVTSLQGDTMQVKTVDGPVSFTLSTATIFFTTGAQKSAIEFQKEMVDYNAKLGELMQDPQKNAAALKALQIPHEFTQVSLKSSDIKVGDNVAVTPGDKSSFGSYQAAQVSRLSAEQAMPM